MLTKVVRFLLWLKTLMLQKSWRIIFIHFLRVGGKFLYIRRKLKPQLKQLLNQINLSKDMKDKVERIILWITVLATAIWQAIEYITQNIPLN